MTGRKYKEKEFLRNIDIGLLEQYLKPFNLQLPNDIDRDNPDVDKLLNFLESLDPDIKDKVELGFIDINLMATESGVASLLFLSSNRGKNLQDEIGKLENSYNQAVYFYLHCKEIFDDCLAVGTFEYLPSKAEKIGRLKVSVEEVTKTEVKERLSKDLIEYFKKEDGRGENCQIDVYHDNDRVYFHALPQDYLKSSYEYETDGSLRRRPVKNIFGVVFVYYPKEGKIELNARGGRKRQNDLFNIFNAVVLNDENPIPETEQTYDFNRVLQDDFTMPYKPGDNVEYAFLRAIRLSHHKKYGERITIETERNAVMEGADNIHRMLKESNIDLDYYNVTQATFKIKFKGDGNRGSVTFKITYPDMCDLNDTETHRKAREYLKHWGLTLTKDGDNN